MGRHQARPTRRVWRSSAPPWHGISPRGAAATIRSPFIVSERLDARWPMDDIVAGLNRQSPDMLVAYASMIRTLAGEQLAGRLQALQWRSHIERLDAAIGRNQ
jgi:phenylacetate-CoA ligase